LEKLLNKDQVLCLKNGSMRGSKWSTETLIKAYKIKLTCGSAGYDVPREMGQLSPSQRTLHRRIEHLKFSPGLLNEILTQLKIKVETMKDEEKHCSILLDEIAITPKYDYHPSTGLVLGKPTVPSSSGKLEELATHGLVYMISGVTTRWIQIVGYQLTGKSFDANYIKMDIIHLIYEAETMQVSTFLILIGKRNPTSTFNRIRDRRRRSIRTRH
jgi:hypothetical protein